MNIEKLNDRYWKTKTINDGEIIEILIDCYDTWKKEYANPSNNKNFINDIESIKSDSFALKKMYIDEMILWREQEMDYEISDDELNALSNLGIDVNKFLNKDYIEILKWKSLFKLISINVSFYFNSITNEKSLLLDGTVRVPGYDRFTIRLGDKNPKYEFNEEGFIEVG